jgi:DNA-binding SARP family transcriptional activator
MAEFRLTLLGTFAPSGNAPFAMPSKKAQALLAYLATPVGLPHRREKLASMLWSDRPEESARQNLRQCLTAIRKMSGGGEELPIFAEGDSLRLDRSNVAVDVAEFEQAPRSRDPNGLVQAFALYRGEFLEGLNLQAEPIEEWLVGLVLLKNVSRRRARAPWLPTICRR